MKRMIALALSVAVLSGALSGCDTNADKGSTPPKDKLGTPAKGPLGGGGGNQGGSAAPQVLPPPPEK